MQLIGGEPEDQGYGEEDLVWSATQDRLRTPGDSPGPLGRQSRRRIVEAEGNR